MSIVICPGIHSPELTESFIDSLINQQNLELEKNWLIFPATNNTAYSPIAIFQWLAEREPIPKQAPSMIFIAFSAGVVGTIGAALNWEMRGGKIKAFLAIDGWGVPLIANFPIHRLSHDYFTYWSSALLGTGLDSFYCDPPVEHLDLWRSPDTSLGWWVKHPGCQIRCSARDFILTFLEQYEVSY
jgi:hypothetical protein